MYKNNCLDVSLLVFLGALFLSFKSLASVPYGKDFHVFQSVNAKTNPIGYYITLLKDGSAPIILEEQPVQNMRNHSSDFGPYSLALIESNIKEGRQYFNQGEPEIALQNFLKALHLLRISEGLNTKNQKPILRNVQASYFLLQDFQGLKRAYEYLFYLIEDDSSTIDASKLKFLLEYMEWRRESVRRNIVSRADSLIDLFELNKQVLDLVVSNDQIESQLQVELSLSQLSNLYLIAHFFKSSIKSFNLPLRQDSSNVDRGYESSTERKLRLLVSNLESEGRRVIERSFGDTEISDSQAFELKVALGDWYQWNSNYSRARIYYKEAYDIFESSGNQISRRMFVSPVELPSNGVFRNWTVVEKSADDLIFLTRFNVSRSGKAAKIELLNGEGYNKPESSKFLRMLRNTRFRPKIVDGQVVGSTAVVRRYLFFEK